VTGKLQAIRGMEDVLPDASPLWERLEEACHAIFRQYGYRNIRTPLVEPTALFVRGIGEATDIVEKEMYVFEDRNGESLALRPEATAGIVRAAIEHNFLYNGPMRVWTSGPMFRYERPQKGRQRQFHQFDVEALGFEGPDVDAEQIVMLGRLWKALGIEGCELHVNSIRLLDSKHPPLMKAIEGAPKLLDHIGDAAAKHFEALKGLLDVAGLKYTVNPRLVRGLDYYNRSVFEWITPNIGAQSTIAGGGRYDALFEQLGGKPTPACGFGMGMERVILTMQACGVAAGSEVDVFVVHSGDAAQVEAWRLAEQWRDAGRRVVLGAGGSFKSQMKKADASGARFAVIIGDDEVAAGSVTLKPLRGGGEQKRLAPREALEEVS
jgi:histidyl-tRNA synthetase